MNVFQCVDYTSYIKYLIKKNHEVRGYQSRMAEAIGTHGSYLSRVISGEVQLTMDQAASLSHFWGMDKNEADYWIALVNLARAGTPYLRGILESQLSEIRSKHEELSSRLKQSKHIQSNETGLYYSSWHYSAIHMLLLISRFQTVTAISNRLNISIAMTESGLAALQTLNLTKKNGDRWSVLEKDIHMSNKLLWAPIFHSNWRQRTALQVFNQDSSEVHFSSIHAMSLKDYMEVKEVLLQALDNVRKIANKSKDEDVFFIGVDAFKI